MFKIPELSFNLVELGGFSGVSGVDMANRGLGSVKCRKKLGVFPLCDSCRWCATHLEHTSIYCGEQHGKDEMGAQV